MRVGEQVAETVDAPVARAVGDGEGGGAQMPAENLYPRRTVLVGACWLWAEEQNMRQGDDWSVGQKSPMTQGLSVIPETCVWLDSIFNYPVAVAIGSYTYASHS